ncbi:polyphosphate kinase 2 [Brevundimonas sp.]|uniref:polyphosphate kinase 2 n=1 Tax=Brevundimonas sp. TaxID=1871086 RepID=UPI00286A2F44|nr:polyphosphate kinase 2 [Brevundimonas sp.]
MARTKDYDKMLEALQVELVDTQHWAIEQGLKIVVVFEGRDTAGKDGAIKRIVEYASPRQTRIVALPKPTERESTQWYFQRYVSHLPAAGELVLLNRSWYNRAGVEPVMEFCTAREHEHFLNDAPRFERSLTGSGIILIKLWLDISKDEQARRLEERMRDPLKKFKVSSLDAEAQIRWDAYTAARDRMLAETHHRDAPWTIIATDDKKTARLNIIRHILHRLDRPGAKIGHVDKAVVFDASHIKGRLNA